MKPEEPTGRGARPRHDLDEVVGAERKTRRGPQTKVSLDELVGMGRTVVDRLRPYVERGVGRLRARFHRK